MPQKKKVQLIVTLVILFVLVPLGVIELSLHGVRQQIGGSRSENWTMLRRNDRESGLKNTPKRDNVDVLQNDAEIITPMVYVFYKINCPYCETAHDASQRLINDTKQSYPNMIDHIKYVNVESTIGKQLVQEYDIQYSATTTIIDSNGKAVSFGQTKKSNNKITADLDSYNQMKDEIRRVFPSNN